MCIRLSVCVFRCVCLQTYVCVTVFDFMCLSVYGSVGFVLYLCMDRFSRFDLRKGLHSYLRSVLKCA